MARPKSGKSKPHEPTEITKAEVAALVSFGVKHEDIASHLGIHPDTLVKHYKNELDNSVVRANAKVAAKLFRKATDENDLSAQIFWLKTRGRWRTTDEKDKDKDDKASSLLEKLIDKLVD